MTRYWASHALIGTASDTVVDGVVIDIDGDRIASISDPGQAVPEGAAVLRGLTMPGLVNAHSHAFHRALRGRTQTERGSFWTWREQMYAVAARLTPDNYERLATAVFAEMVLSGITTVGEFHYLHHRPGGLPYEDPTAMSRALARAAKAAGIRMTLLDTCYLAGGFAPEGAETTHVPLADNQLRFGDGDAAGWAARATAVAGALEGDGGTVKVGAAIHSVRAVPRDQLATVVAWADARDAPLHFHLSEQPAENDDCLRIHGVTPSALLHEAGAIGTRSSAIHATHLTADDIDRLGRARAFACFCVTTERDLADGIGPSSELVEAGARLTVGSDSHAVIDLFEETRGIETGSRVTSNVRGQFLASYLLGAASRAGAESLGWHDAGVLAPGALADFVTVSLESARLAGWSPDSLVESIVYAASGADITTVVVGGRLVVQGGRHLSIDVPAALTASIEEVTR